MKKLTVVLFIALVACSQSKEEKAKSLIKENMKTSMNDFKSYEAVEFGKLDSTYTSYHNDENYISLTGWEKQYKLNYKSWNDQSKEFDNDRQSLREILKHMEKESRNIDSVLKLQIKFIKEYTHKFDGLTMTHSFRGKNKMGALVLNSFKFYFDSSLTKVTNQENLNK